MAATDDYNVVESAIVTALKADTIINGLAGTIREKLMENPDTEAVYENQLPLIGVFVTGPGAESRRPGGNQYTEEINVIIEVVMGGGYNMTSDSTVKRIVSEIRRFFREENKKMVKLGQSDLVITQFKNMAGDVSANFMADRDLYIMNTMVKVELMRNV